MVNWRHLWVAGCPHPQQIAERNIELKRPAGIPTPRVKMEVILDSRLKYFLNAERQNCSISRALFHYGGARRWS